MVRRGSGRFGCRAGGICLPAFPPRPKLTDKDTIVLADFANTTGDPVFDGTMRQGLSIQLEQSPFLNLLSDQRIEQTLLLMARPKGTRAHRRGGARGLPANRQRGGIEWLYRAGGHALSAYLVRGELLQRRLAGQRTGASERQKSCARRAGKDDCGDPRQTGRIPASVQKLDTPLENVTTPSLEALQAYSLGHEAEMLGHGSEATTFYERAIGLDANFAMAYGGWAFSISIPMRPPELRRTYRRLINCENASASARSSASPWFTMRWSRAILKRRAHPISWLPRFTLATRRHIPIWPPSIPTWDTTTKPHRQPTGTDA